MCKLNIDNALCDKKISTTQIGKKIKDYSQKYYLYEVSNTQLTLKEWREWVPRI